MNKNKDGTITLTQEEAAALRAGVRRWLEACDKPGTAASSAVVDLAIDLSDILMTGTAE